MNGFFSCSWINVFHVLFKLSCAFSFCWFVVTLHQALNLWFLENDFSCWTFNNFFLPVSICRILNLLYTFWRNFESLLLGQSDNKSGFRRTSNSLSYTSSDNGPLVTNGGGFFLAMFFFCKGLQLNYNNTVYLSTINFLRGKYSKNNRTVLYKSHWCQNR